MTKPIDVDALLEDADGLLQMFPDYLAKGERWCVMVRDLAAALRAVQDGLTVALHAEQDRTHRYHERMENAERERDELRKDAERYRWLREGYKGCYNTVTGAALDTAVDDAMEIKRRDAIGSEGKA